MKAQVFGPVRNNLPIAALNSSNISSFSLICQNLRDYEPVDVFLEKELDNK